MTSREGLEGLGAYTQGEGNGKTDSGETSTTETIKIEGESGTIYTVPKEGNMSPPPEPSNKQESKGTAGIFFWTGGTKK